jgi:hypothetical protein
MMHSPSEKPADTDNVATENNRDSTNESQDYFVSGWRKLESKEASRRKGCSDNRAGDDVESGYSRLKPMLWGFDLLRCFY